MPRRNPALVVFGNPEGAHSETHAWKEVRRLLTEVLASQRLSEKDHHKLDLAITISKDMQAQIARGVHRNPQSLAKRTKIANHVQAIAYVHAKDHGQYVHGFGDAELNEQDLRRGVLKLSDLHDRTDVEMYGNADGTVTLVGTHGQPLAALFS